MISKTQDEIISTWQSDSDIPILSIKCMVFNQEKFVSQTLDGFLIQETTFPFEVVIHDDASTDNTANIIREYESRYPKIIKPIYETENQYSKHDGSLSRIINSHIKGKYVAYCEGDDYWTDSNKIQKQVEFLENNLNYGLVYSKAKQFNQEKNKYFLKGWGEDFVSAQNLLETNNKIPTLTICYKRELYDKYREEIKPETHKWLMGDYPLVLWFAFNSKIKYFNYYSGVYRVLPSSASHNYNVEKEMKFILSAYDIKRFFAEQYNVKLKPFDVKRREINLYLGRGYRKEAAAKIENLERKTKADQIKLIICKSGFLFFCFSIGLRIRKILRNRQ